MGPGIASEPQLVGPIPEVLGKVSVLPHLLQAIVEVLVHLGPGSSRALISDHQLKCEPVHHSSGPGSMRCLALHTFIKRVPNGLRNGGIKPSCRSRRPPMLALPHETVLVVTDLVLDNHHSHGTPLAV